MLFAAIGFSVRKNAFTTGQMYSAIGATHHIFCFTYLSCAFFLRQLRYITTEQAVGDKTNEEQ